MGEQGVEDGAKDASLWSTEVMFPILTDWSQSQMLGCRPSVDSLSVSMLGLTVLKAEL